MSQPTVHHILTFFAVALVSGTIACAQSPASRETVTLPVKKAVSDWQLSQSLAAPRQKLFVVTFNQPQRRQTCHVESFTLDKLVCSRAIGHRRTYLRQQVLALIVPGDDDTRLRFVLGLNALLGAAIWGTVMLAPICPACAVVTGVVALGLFGAAGAVLIGDGQPERLFYLAPGQKLTGKFRFVEP